RFRTLSTPTRNMAQFTVYSSTDTGAPEITGVNGALVALLDACLVTGYGAKVGAGWTKPYTGANKAVFKQGADSCGFYLRVQDDGPGAGGAREARLTGYEVMTDVDTGSAVFPFASQGLAGNIAAFAMRKSDTLDTTYRNWYLLADSRTFYLWTGSSYPTYSSTGLMGFGDFYSLVPGTKDAYRCFLAALSREQSGLVTQDYMRHLTAGSSLGGWTPIAGQPPFCVARPWSGMGGSWNAVMMNDAMNGGGYLAGITQHVGGPKATFQLSRTWVGHPSFCQMRGRFRGLWQPLHPVGTFSPGKTFAGSGELAGKTFLAVQTSNSNPIFETSDTLETNA
ncbi:MAG: hypothetical protein ACOYB3_00005, partial [Azonexus sp.]